MASLHGTALTRCTWAPNGDPQNTDRARSQVYEY
jgi:hypothetical protein